MTAKEYVDNLKMLVPSKENLIERGLNEFRADLFYPFYNFIENETKVDVWENDPILDLCTNYESEETHEHFFLRLNELHFYVEDNKENKDYYLFGSFESDALAIHQKTKEIVVLDHEDHYQTVMFHCALNSSKFLDAVFIVAKFGLETLPDKFRGLREDQKIRETIALQCAELAGGMMYHHFYDIWLCH